MSDDLLARFADRVWHGEMREGETMGEVLVSQRVVLALCEVAKSAYACDDFMLQRLRALTAALKEAKP